MTNDTKQQMLKQLITDSLYHDEHYIFDNPEQFEIVQDEDFDKSMILPEYQDLYHLRRFCD